MNDVERVRGRCRYLINHGVKSEDNITGAILHDLVEDTDWAISAVREKCGENVARMVALVTKPENMPKARNDFEAYKKAMMRLVRMWMPCAKAAIQTTETIY